MVSYRDIQTDRRTSMSQQHKNALCMGR